MKRLVLVLGALALGVYTGKKAFEQAHSPAVDAYADFNELVAGRGKGSLKKAREMCAGGPCAAQIDTLLASNEGRSGLGFQTSSSERELGRQNLGNGFDLVEVETTLTTTYDPLREPIRESDYVLVHQELQSDTVYLEIDEYRTVHGSFGEFLVYHDVEMTETRDGWRVVSFETRRGEP